MNNPWLQIPAQDYEGHMSSPEVGQLPVLNHLLAAALSEIRPASLAVIGCCTGNGFEHINPDLTKRIVGVDINPSYLDLLRQRFAPRLLNLSLVQQDVTSSSFHIEPVEMIFAALIFEYVDVQAALSKMVESLVAEGILVTVLQMESRESPPISPSPYKSIAALRAIMKLVDSEGFTKACSERGLFPLKDWVMPLNLGKAFYVGYFKKNSSRK